MQLSSSVVCSSVYRPAHLVTPPYTQVHTGFGKQELKLLPSVYKLVGTHYSALYITVDSDWSVNCWTFLSLGQRGGSSPEEVRR